MGLGWFSDLGVPNRSYESGTSMVTGISPNETTRNIENIRAFGSSGSNSRYNATENDLNRHIPRKVKTEKKELMGYLESMHFGGNEKLALRAQEGVRVSKMS